MEIISTLSAFKHLEGVRLRPVMSNPVRARAKGHIDGVDFQRTGDITRIEAPHLKKMLDNDMIPVLGPLGIDSKGDMFNVNADTVALEVAATLKAEKLIFLTNVDGILDADGNRISAKSDGEMQVLLDEGKAFTGGMIPKVTACIEATTRGVRRVHVLNGLTDGVLLFEVFSTEGVGTMIYSGRYENIRPALESDVHQLMELIRIGVSQGRLKERTRHEVIDELRDFLVYEVDNRVVGCVHVPHYPEIKASEVACLQVDDRYKADGAGAGLLQYAERVAQDRSDEFIFALTTQTGAWFESQNYTEGSSKQLPPARRAQQEERGSTVFVKKLS
jgi:amino-acid N-acetyltransferase